jgi:VIT1/CCC1 family predicted Fe2+/Mn2+ transporter
MSRLRLHPENHFVSRIGWLRAAVLGANDGIISTASLIVGVAAAATTQNEVLLAGVAGLVAGAMSMAAGEYVSVSSQSDTEHANIARERAKLRAFPPSISCAGCNLTAATLYITCNTERSASVAVIPLPVLRFTVQSGSSN